MKKEIIGYWVTVGLFSLALTGSGAMSLMSPPEFLAELDKLGFPDWFGHWLGVWKISGVAVLLAPGLPRLKEWAYAGFTISLTSAAISHLMAGDPVANAMPPLVLLTLGLGSWALRPASRKL
jgi:hypothetical protein